MLNTCGHLRELDIMGQRHFSLVPNASGLGLLFCWPYLGDGAQSLQTGELLPELKNGLPTSIALVNPITYGSVKELSVIEKSSALQGI